MVNWINVVVLGGQWASRGEGEQRATPWYDFWRQTHRWMKIEKYRPLFAFRFASVEIN